MPSDIVVSIDRELKDKCPQLCLGVLSTEIENSSFSEKLWDEIKTQTAFIQTNYSLESIKQIPIVSATRSAYKITGKDPNRYRPAGEGIIRRVLRGGELYKINTAVDLVNLWALKFGYSVGGFDADKIVGEVVAGIGSEDEPYQAIGKGTLNIEGLPVLRDREGGIGTPTSDELRTALSIETSRMLVVFNAYAGKQNLLPVLDYALQTMQTFLGVNKVYTSIVE